MKVSAYSALTTAQAGDLFYIVRPGAPPGNKILFSDLLASIVVPQSQVTGLVAALAGKQPTGNYVTALTGDVTASGPGSVPATLATVNANVGSFGASSLSLSVTVNAKGLVTAVSEQAIAIAESQVVNLVTDLSTLASAIVGKQASDPTLTALAAFNTNGLLTQTAADTFVARSILGTSNRVSVTNGDGVAGSPTVDVSASYAGQASITTLGTITVGGLGAGAVIGGVTMTLGSDASGDVYYRSSGGILTRLAKGSDGQVLTLASGLPSWAAAGGSGANTALSNLAAVAINTTLVSDTTNTDDLGTAPIRWKDLYLSGNIISAGIANRIGVANTNDATADTMLTSSGITKRALTLQGARAQGNADPLFAITDFTAGANVLRIDTAGQIVANYFNLNGVGLVVPQDRKIAFSTSNLGSSGSAGSEGVWLANLGSGATRGMQLVNDNGEFGWFVQGGIKRVSAQFDKASSTTLANVTGLSVNVIAGRTYSFEANLFVNADVTGGSKYSIGGTATATAIIFEIELLDDGTNGLTIADRQTALAGASGQAGTTAGRCRIKGLITVNAGGTLTVTFAQNVAGGTSSVLVGSDFIVRDNP
jgi:hypothetical protein